MKAIVLVGHGNLPIEFKKSAELIIGDNENVFAVPLSPQDGKEEYAEKLNQIKPKLDKYDSVFVFVDLMGGSPGNTATEVFFKDKRFCFISGVNLPMLIMAMSDDISSDELILEGRREIKNINDQLSCENIICNKSKENIKDNSVKKLNGRPKTIKNVRIDARGIHGQVATAWIPKLQVNRIIVIDDLAVKDEMQKMALKMAKPNHVKLSILSCSKAVERLNDVQSYQGEDIMIILQRVQTLQTLDSLNFHFKEINLGNIPNRIGTKAYRKTIHLTQDEKDIIISQIKKGTHFTAQMVPNDSLTDFDKIIDD